MASVQTPAAAMPLATSAPPNGITQQQVQEVWIVRVFAWLVV